jgi:hypothetical protein
MQNITITTQPAIEPVTVAECKHFMRVDTNDDYDLISDLIVMARQLCEEHTRRKFINTGITLALDGFPYGKRDMWWDGVQQMAVSELYAYADCIKLPFPPAISVTSITTYDSGNNAHVFSSAAYRLDTNGNIYLNDGYVWPSDLRDYDAVRIVYVAGYGATGSSVPAPINHAIKMTVAAMYDDRSCVSIPQGAMNALAPYRLIEERRNAMR